MAPRSTITAADRRVLLTVFAYGYVCAPQLRRLCFPQHKHGRGTRQHTKKLLDRGYLRRTRVKYPYQEGFCPIWYLTKEGAVYLAEYFNDDRYLDAFTDSPREARGEHWLALGDAHMALDVALQTNTSGEVAIRQWTNEWQPVQDAQPGGPKYKLQTKLSQQPPLSCNPDAGFLLEVTVEIAGEPATLRKVHYVEVDRGSRSSAPRTVAAQKTPGYAVLAERGLHKVHFPEANYESFSILLITSNASRLRRLAAELDERRGSHLWPLTTMEDLQRFPYEEVVFDTKLQQRALLKQVGDSNVTSSFHRRKLGCSLGEQNCSPALPQGNKIVPWGNVFVTWPPTARYARRGLSKQGFSARGWYPRNQHSASHDSLSWCAMRRGYQPRPRRGERSQRACYAPPPATGSPSLYRACRATITCRSRRYTVQDCFPAATLMLSIAVARPTSGQDRQQLWTRVDFFRLHRGLPASVQFLVSYPHLP